MVGQLLGHYRVDAELGAGGMGVVYRAYDTRFSVVVTSARVDAEAGRTGPAARALPTLIGEAKGVSEELEMRLALGQVEMASGDVTAARAHLRELETAARAKGFHLIARKAAEAGR